MRCGFRNVLLRRVGLLLLTADTEKQFRSNLRQWRGPVERGVRLSEDGKVEGSVRRLAMKRLAGKSDPTADQVEKWTPEKMIPELLSVKVRVGPNGRSTFSLDARQCLSGPFAPLTLPSR